MPKLRVSETDREIYSEAHQLFDLSNVVVADGGNDNFFAVLLRLCTVPINTATRNKKGVSHTKGEGGSAVE